MIPGSRHDAAIAARFLRRRFGGAEAELAVVLGSGLGMIADSLEGSAAVPSQEIPGFPAATVAGHAGKVLMGRWDGRAVLIFQGRVHFYEGHSPETVTLAVLTAAELGVRRLILTNAAGSCDHRVPPGSLIRATDLLDLFLGRFRGRDGERFTGRGGVLDAGLGRVVDAAAVEEGIRLHHGILCGSLGPSYETASEIRLWRRFGASAACMSTVPEAIAARGAEMRVAAVSLITNYGTGLAGEPLDHKDVVAWAAKAGEDLGRLLRRTTAMLA